jgi:hypothetical protein
MEKAANSSNWRWDIEYRESKAIKMIKHLDYGSGISISNMI